MSRTLARTLSILGHPVLVLPLVVMAMLAAQDGWRASQLPAMGFAGFAALVMGFSWWQVRRGHWRHVDASAKHERSRLNRFLFVSIAAGAAAVAWRGDQPMLAIGLGLSSAIIAVALVSARWCTLSLHLAFSVFAALLLREAGIAWMLGALLFAAAIAWSRHALARHTWRDLAAGSVAGLCAGLAFWPLASRAGG